MIDRYTDHAANERTFLAWVRTAIAVVGFGIAGSRLGSQPPAVWADAVMLAAGALVVALAYLRMLVVRHRINSPDSETDEATPADFTLLLVVVAFFGLLGSFALRVTV